MQVPFWRDGRRTAILRLARGMLIAVLVAIVLGWLVAPGRVDRERDRLVAAVRIAAKRAESLTVAADVSDPNAARHLIR